MKDVFHCVMSLCVCFVRQENLNAGSIFTGTGKVEQEQTVLRRK